MILLVAMAILVALSDLFSENAEEIKLDPSVEKKVPIYVAILYSLIFPLSAGFMNTLVKYTKINLRLEATDWV